MQSRSRAGFTLIELMVAMALTLFIMVILSQAFILALDAFSGMKGIGDMQANLRTAEVVLHDDLRQDHLEGKRRLSDQTMTGLSQISAQHPQAGFFAVRRSSALLATAGAPYYFEGNDASGLPSYRATDHMLYLTVKRKGNRQENFFSTSLQGTPLVLKAFFDQQTAYGMNSYTNLPYATQTSPYAVGAVSGSYSSQWAEVLYYLIQTGSTEEPNNPTSTLGTPIFSLYRAQFVMVPDAVPAPDGTSVNTQFATPAYSAVNIDALSKTTFAAMSCNPITVTVGATTTTTLTFFSPAVAAQANATLGNRVIPDLSPSAFVPPVLFDPTNNRICAASTLVLPNVISFEVQIMRVTGTTGLPDTGFASSNLPNYTGVAGATYGIYDTTRLGVAGYPDTGLKGIQITLRVWETKTRQTRQATIVQDL